MEVSNQQKKVCKVDYVHLISDVTMFFCFKLPHVQYAHPYHPLLGLQLGPRILGMKWDERPTIPFYPDRLVKPGVWGSVPFM